MPRPSVSNKKKVYSVSLDQKVKEELCKGFNGSLTRTLLFLNDLMLRAYKDGLVDDEYIEKVMKNHKQKVRKDKGE